jgi:hypothetical protein
MTFAVRHRKVLATLLVAGLMLLPALPASAEGAPFLWRVIGPKSVHYLAGSVHLLPRTEQDLPPALDAVYDQANGLVFESDLGGLKSADTQVQMLMEGRAGSGGLAAEVGPRLFAQTQSRLKDVGLPPTFCDALRAWFCGLMAEVAVWRKAGFDGATGIDEQLYDRAAEDGKHTRWFEQPKAHLALFTAMPPDIARDFLASSLDDQSMSADSPEALYRAWRNNDIAAIEKLIGEWRRRYPAVYERLLAARNRAWMPQLEQILGESQTQLIVVGAAHYVGPDGLVARLRAKGYSVTPVVNFVPLQTVRRDRAGQQLAQR